VIAVLLLTCWLIACVYVPLVLWITRDPPSEVRRVMNALVMQRAQAVANELPRPTARRLSHAEAAALKARWEATWPQVATWRAPVESPAYTDEVLS
jgi:hypothetical protein